jgi:hypothetical protein
MPKRLQLRALTEAEQTEIEQLARSRTVAARLVEWAKVIWLASQGQGVPSISGRWKLSESTVGRWLKRSVPLVARAWAVRGER